MSNDKDQGRTFGTLRDKKNQVDCMKELEQLWKKDGFTFNSPNEDKRNVYQEILIEVFHKNTLVGLGWSTIRDAKYIGDIKSGGFFLKEFKRQKLITLAKQYGVIPLFFPKVGNTVYVIDLSVKYKDSKWDKLPRNDRDGGSYIDYGWFFQFEHVGEA